MHTIEGTITFRGYVRTGLGKYSAMVIPGRSKVPDAPSSWPEKLERGSLNIGLDGNACPSQFVVNNEPDVRKLDSGLLPPAFVIPQRLIKNNGLRPTEKNPSKGTAQVWRARLYVVDKDLRAECWVLRRIGSRIKKQLEIVSDRHIRNELGLVDGSEVEVILFPGSS